MFFKNESLNKIACVFDPKADHATKIKREYEQVLESYVYNLCTIADKIEINFKPKDFIMTPMEMPNFIIFQLFLIPNKNFSLEMLLVDRNSNVKKRIQMSNLITQIEEKHNLLLIPLKRLLKNNNSWINLNIPIYHFIENVLNTNKNQFFIEQIIVHSYCKLRRIVFSDISLENNDESPKNLMNVIATINLPLVKKANGPKLTYLNEILSCHSKFNFINENYPLQEIKFGNNDDKILENFNLPEKKEQKILIKNKETIEKIESNPNEISPEPHTKKSIKKKLSIIKKNPTLKNPIKKLEKSINNETISKNQIQSKTFFSNKDLKKETEKLPQIKNKILTKAKTLSLLTSKPQINKEISPEKKNIIRKKIDFEKQAQKFNSINLNDEEKSDNFIYESIKVNSIDNTTEKYDDGSLETVQSVDYPSMMLQSKSSDNKEISDVKVTFENEFLENNSRKKEVNLERIKLFKNSTLITYKNNEKIILERKDNHENKEFINEIDEMMNLNCRKDGEKYLFDPVLNCFYDQTTQTYYHKI